MTGNDAELAMIGLVIVILIFCFALIWFIFMVPMERGMYKRRMELLRKKLEQNEERLRRQEREEDENAGREGGKRASGGGR
jgi:flagellar biosynthesis/type III secretory pathway M-ring protein FliF/YscJ